MRWQALAVIGLVAAPLTASAQAGAGLQASPEDGRRPSIPSSVQSSVRPSGPSSLQSSAPSSAQSSAQPSAQSAAQSAAQLILAVDDTGEPLSGAGGSPRGDYRRMAGYAGSARAAALADTLAREYGLSERAAWTIAPLNLRCMLFSIQPGDDLAQVILRLKKDGRVALVQPLQEFEALAEAPPAAVPVRPQTSMPTATAMATSTATTAPTPSAVSPSASLQTASPALPSATAALPYNDPYFPLQRAFQQMGVTPLQQLPAGTRVKLAVIDTGVDARHPDLEGQLPRQRDYVSGNGAYVDTFPERHGTEVMGLIAARANNKTGIVGVAPGVQLLSYRACWTATRGASNASMNGSSGSGSASGGSINGSGASGAVAAPGAPPAPPPGSARCNSFTLAQALGAAIADGADVINLSLGGPSDPLLTRLVTYAQSRGAIVVAAAPPQRLGGGFPSEVPGTLVVASAEDAAPDAQIAAPGRSVLTTIPGGEYDMESGSSLACAQVSGIVALLRSLMPGAEAQSLRRALRESMNPSTGSVNACQAARHLGVQGLRCS